MVLKKGTARESTGPQSTSATPTPGIIEVKILGSSKRSAMWGYFSVGSSLSRRIITIETYFDQGILQVSTTCQTCDPKHNAGSV